ncbi:MAG TPA: acyl-ACP thioesterase [Clostridiaceae bacterium]|nr:acyl-ACP thioesterase [Clostridiaceae bacterium]
MNPIMTEREYDIHYYEVDYKKRCLITSIMNYFQDIAIFQSMKVGVGIDYLEKNKLAWVLYKWNIHIERYPVYGERVKVGTSPYSFDKFYAFRKFNIADGDNQLLVSADTMWLLLHTENKKPIRIIQPIYDAYNVDKIPKRIPMPAIERMTRVDYEKGFQVRYTDIDTNMHVNNVKYVEWIIETIPVDTVLHYSMENVLVTYKKETVYGEDIKVQTELMNKGETLECLHRITGKGNIELCIAKTIWKRD